MAFQFLSADEPWMIQAAELLCRPSVLSDLRKSDARCIVSYMRPCRFEDGDVLLQEGEQGENAHMLLVLHGDVSVETSVMSREQPVVVTVLGEGADRRDGPARWCPGWRPAWPSPPSSAPA
jgi:hypothetical protein